MTNSTVLIALLLFYTSILTYQVEAGNVQSQSRPPRNGNRHKLKAASRLKSHPLFSGANAIQSFSADPQMSTMSTFSESSSIYAGSSLGWSREDTKGLDRCFTSSALVIRDWMATFSRSFTVFNGNIVHVFGEYYDSMPHSLLAVASSGSGSACSTPTRHSRHTSFGSPCFSATMADSDYSSSFEDAQQLVSNDVIAGGRNHLNRRQFTVDNNYRVVDALPYPSSLFSLNDGVEDDSTLVTARTLDTRETVSFHLFKSPLIKQDDEHEQITMLAFLYWFLQKRYDEVRLRYGDSYYGFPTVSDLVKVTLPETNLFDDRGHMRPIRQHDMTEILGFVTDRIEYVHVWEKAAQKYRFNPERLIDKLHPGYNVPSTNADFEFEEIFPDSDTDDDDEKLRSQVQVKLIDLPYVQSTLKALLLSIRHMHRSCVHHGQLTSKFILCSMSHCRILLSPSTSRFVVDDPADATGHRLTDYQANDLMVFFQDAQKQLNKYKCPASHRAHCKELFALLESKPPSASRALKHAFFDIDLTSS